MRAVQVHGTVLSILFNSVKLKSEPRYVLAKIKFEQIFIAQNERKRELFVLKEGSTFKL